MKEELAVGTGAQFGSWNSLLSAQQGFGAAKRLASHSKSAHGGKVDPKCMACLELSSKTEKEKGGKS